MIQITLADAINHIADCGQCAHLKSYTHEFTKALLLTAVDSAHNRSAEMGYGPVCQSKQ